MVDPVETVRSGMICEAILKMPEQKIENLKLNYKPLIPVLENVRAKDMAHSRSPKTQHTARQIRCGLHSAEMRLEMVYIWAPSTRPLGSTMMKDFASLKRSSVTASKCSKSMPVSTAL
ncbi:hypothetical protein CTRI78_v001859 [Colletotrichum trifolii]|uniref:Uncharacterized protein n=1 Tax=Colletotrichum trifolii TaxID=5466 RepID=A0A4R8RRY7_COLTR|nr:hypothetical protein CTRI78_v001859 [Colletotrichum trifolii]